MLTNHHTHTCFSDGRAFPEEYVVAAIEKGFGLLGFTEHSPLPFETPFAFRHEKKDEYLDILTSLKQRYETQIEIMTGMEIDFVPGMSEHFSDLKSEYQLDYIIGSVHLVKTGLPGQLWFTDGPDFRIYDQGVRDYFGGDIRKAVTAFYHQTNQMIESQTFDIIGHFDKIKMHNNGRFFSESESWYTSLVNETIQLIKEKSLIVEVNTRGIYKKRSSTTYPGIEILKVLKQRDVQVMINSDAHLPAELDGAFDVAMQLIREAGYRETVYYTRCGWQSQPIAG